MNLETFDRLESKEISQTCMMPDRQTSWIWSRSLRWLYENMEFCIQDGADGRASCKFGVKDC